MSLLLKKFKSDYSIFFMVPILLLLYVTCTCLLLGNALQVCHRVLFILRVLFIKRKSSDTDMYTQPVLVGAFEDSWYALPNVVFAVAAPHMIVGRELPCGAWEALKISMPV
jgi:hypothetical protein